MPNWKISDCRYCHGRGFIEVPKISGNTKLFSDPLNRATIKTDRVKCPECFGSDESLLHQKMQNQIFQVEINQMCGLSPPDSTATQTSSRYAPDELEEEDKFLKDWEVMRMSKRGWGSLDKDVAKVWLDENKAVLCAKFPYRAEVIDEIRLKIPKGKKVWNPIEKVWEFSVEGIDVVVEILEKEFGKENVIDLTQASPPPPPSPLTNDPLLSLLDKEDIKAIYVLLCKKYHPDVGGDGVVMAKINAIFNKVK